MNIADIKYRFKHHMIADTNIHVVENCEEHKLDLPHAHYTHRWWLEWVDNLTWRWEQRKFKKLTKSAWIADWTDPTKETKQSLEGQEDRDGD